MADLSAIRAFAEAFEDLLRTILRMRGSPETCLHIAPADGHTLSAKTMECLQRRKSPRAIQLLQNMPYIQDSDFGRTHIAPSTPLHDYWHDPRATWDWYMAWHTLYDTDELDPEPWVEASEVPLSGDADPYNTVIVVDTGSSIIEARSYPGQTSFCECHEEVAAGVKCGSLCKKRHDVTKMPAIDLIHEYRRKLLDLEWLADTSSAKILDVDADGYPEEWVLRLRETYEQCGWPGLHFDIGRFRDIAHAPEFKEDQSFDNYSDNGRSAD